MSIAVADSDGWVVESSEGTPTQPEVSIAESATPETAIAADDADTSDPEEPRAPSRDIQGRFAPKDAETGEKQAEEQAGPEETPVEAAKPKRNDPQARIDKAIKAQREAERRAFDLEQRLAQVQQPRVAPQPQHVTGPNFPDYGAWSEQPGNEGKPYEEYTDARTDWRYEMRQRQDREQFEARQSQEKALTLREKGKSVYTDWDEIDWGALPIPQPIAREVLTDPDGHRLAYALAKDPVLLQQMNAGPIQAGIALGTLKARFSAASNGPARPASPTAPPPIQPVGSSPTHSTSSLDDKPFEKWTEADYRKANELDRKRGLRV